MTMTDGKSESKQSVLTRLLNFEYILVFINPNVSGLVLPDYLLAEPTVTLKLSNHFEGKMEILPDKIEAVLRFKGQYFPSVIPFAALWGASTPKGSNYFWLESAPEAVLASMAQSKSGSDSGESVEKKKPAEEPPSRAETKPTPFLRRVK